MTSIETPFRRRIAALHKWDEEVNGIKDASGFTIQAPRACVRVSLANGDEYLVRDEDELTWLNYENVHQSARGAIRNFDNF